MTDEESARRDAALKRLDKLSATYDNAASRLDKARDALQAEIVSILMNREAAPSEVSAHTPYDRNHIRRLAKAAGVPSLREPTVRSVKRDD